MQIQFIDYQKASSLTKIVIKQKQITYENNSMNRKTYLKQMQDIIKAECEEIS